MRMFDPVKREFVDKSYAKDVIVVFEPNRPSYELRRIRT